jgi:hypothetical protein
MSYSVSQPFYLSFSVSTSSILSGYPEWGWKIILSQSASKAVATVVQIANAAFRQNSHKNDLKIKKNNASR